MAKKIRFFNEFLWARPVEEMIDKLEEAGNEDIVVDLFTYGGETQPTWTLAKYIEQYEGETTVEVDGIAASMGGVLMAYFDKRGVADTAKVMFHGLSGQLGDKTDEIRKSLYNRLSSVIDEDKFNDVAGIKLKDLMFQEGEERKDIWLNAKQLKQIGFATYTYKLTPKKAKNVMELTKNTCYAAVLNIDNNLIKNDVKMTYSELKSQHADLFEKIFNEGVQAEKERVNAALAWLDTDKEAVLDLIKTDKKYDQSFGSQMQAKAIANLKVDGMKTDNPKTEGTDTVKDGIEGEDEEKQKALKQKADGIVKRLTGKKR